MYRAKTAIALKFSPILNMGSIARDLGLPYLEFGEAKVENPGRGNEMVTLYYSDRRYAIIYNWVQLQFSIGGGEEDLKQANGPTKAFFEIWEAIQKLDGFSRLREAKVKTWLIAEEADGCPSSADDFRRKFFVDKSLNFGGELADLAVVVEDKKGNRDRNIYFGPYNGRPDFEKHELEVFADDKMFHGPERGVLFIVEFSQDRRDFAFKDFSFLLDESTSLVRSCLR